jgi:hypothetical protein
MAGFIAIGGDGRITDQGFAKMNPSQAGISWVQRPEGNFMVGDYLPGYGAQRGATRQTVAQATTTASSPTVRRTTTVAPMRAGTGQVAAPMRGVGSFGYLQRANPLGVNAMDAGRLGVGGISWNAVAPAEAGKDDVLRELESQAMRELGLGGQLSAQEERQAQQAARGAFAARGMAFGNPAVAAEVLGRDEFSRQRLGERRAFAGGISTMLQGIEKQNADLEQQAALENSRGQMQAQLQNVQDAIRVATANQDDARARELANQAERLQRDIQYADAQLRQQQLAIEQQRVALEAQRLAESGEQWRAELTSRENMAGNDADLRRELSSMEIQAGARRDAGAEAAAANDFYRNRTEAGRIDRNNWNRFGGISGLGTGSNVRQSARNFPGVSAPKPLRTGGWGFVSRAPAKPVAEVDRTFDFGSI